MEDKDDAPPKKRKILIPDIIKRYRETVWPWQQPVEVKKKKLAEHLKNNHDKIYSFDYDLHRYYNTMSVRNKPEKRKENFAHEPPKKKPRILEFKKREPVVPNPKSPTVPLEESPDGLVTEYRQLPIQIATAKETTVDLESRQRYVELKKQQKKGSLQQEEISELQTLQEAIGKEQREFREHMYELLTSDNGKRYRFGSVAQCMLLSKKTEYQRKECKKYPQHYKQYKTYNTKDLMEKTVEVTTFLTQHALKQNGIPLDMNISKHRKDMKDSGVASKFPDKLQIWFDPEEAPAKPSYNIKTPNKPVSRDEETLGILGRADEHYQFVSSTSALTRLFDIGEDGTFSQDVLIPVAVREINGRKSVFLDKKLPNRTETIREKRERRLKNVWRGLLSNGETKNSGPSIQWRKVTLEGANLLVRSNMHGLTKTSRAEEMHIVPATRLDYVSGPRFWGWQRTERSPVSDRLRWWMKMRLRHDHSSKMQLFLAQVNAVKRVKALTKTFTTDNILIDDFEMLNLMHLVPRNLRILKGILDELATLKVGYYLLRAQKGSGEVEILIETPPDNDSFDFDLHKYAETCGELIFDYKQMFRLPEVFIYPGSKRDLDHVPDLFPIPNTAPRERFCNVFEKLGVCKDLELSKCSYRHFKTYTFSHCWEFAACGKCPRGDKCAWPHLNEDELIKTGRKLFHIRQVLTYCSNYLKGHCDETYNCQKEHLTLRQLYDRWDAIPEKHLKPDKLSSCIMRTCSHIKTYNFERKRGGRGKRSKTGASGRGN